MGMRLFCRLGLHSARLIGVDAGSRLRLSLPVFVIRYRYECRHCGKRLRTLRKELA